MNGYSNLLLTVAAALSIAAFTIAYVISSIRLRRKERELEARKERHYLAIVHRIYDDAPVYVSVTVPWNYPCNDISNDLMVFLGYRSYECHTTLYQLLSPVIDDGTSRLVIEEKKQ